MSNEDDYTIVLIDHPVGKRDDRASKSLERRGFRTEWCCPGQGGRLPEPRDDHLAVVVYGGPESVNDLETYPYLREEIAWIENWLAQDRAMFGICLGGQLLARAAGATVERHTDGLHEIGYVEIAPTKGANGFLDDTLHVYHWHNEGFAVPASAELLAEGPTFPNQAYRLSSKVYGIQFHPEVTPQVMERWISEAGHMLSHPGAHSAERQRADAARHDAAMEAWLEDFLDGWLVEALEG